SMYGAKMRELRTAQKLGLRELAKRTLIDYTTLSRIENDLKAVTLSQAVVIAKALGCRVEDML
ncbi:helix-turn-helix domain-containing protein, partial [Streptococcus pneumoniae]